MSNLKKIALLTRQDDGLSFEIDELVQSFKRKNIEVGIFSNSESILGYQPDCVHDTRGDLPPDREQLRLFNYIFRFRRFYGNLFCDRRIFPA